MVLVQLVHLLVVEAILLMVATLRLEQELVQAPCGLRPELRPQQKQSGTAVRNTHRLCDRRHAHQGRMRGCLIQDRAPLPSVRKERLQGAHPAEKPGGR
jgi:hypothetical protein